MIIMLGNQSENETKKIRSLLTERRFNNGK